MIALTCTACQTKLSIDDAFAGGVCRCQHCGTIQTVPGKRPGGPGTTRAGGRPQKALYQQRARSEQAPGTGLDELADAVATSSGLSNRLSSPTMPPTRADQPPVTKTPLLQHPLVIGAAGGVIVLIVVVAVWFMTRDGGSTTPSASRANANASANTPNNSNDSTSATPAVSGPSFCGVKLEEPSVIYLLDRGSATQSSFGYLKEAAYRSIESLGADRKFQIIFWHNDAEAAYPSLMTYATKDNVAAVKRSAEDLAAFGQTDLRPSLEKAIAQKPAAVVIATAKGWELDDGFVGMVSEVRGNANTKVHTFNIGGTPSPALQSVAQKFGGEYRDVSEQDLQTFSR